MTTHYLTSTSEFAGSDARPSINNLGEIAFSESVDSVHGIFVGREGDFAQIAAADPDDSYREPVLNDAGTAAFQRSLTDEATGEFVEEIVTGNGGPLTTVADTTGEFAFFFDFRPPSPNNRGDVAFQATLDDGTAGIFVGPDPIADRVISTGDTLDGSTVQDLIFCEEGLSESGELAFVATLEDTPESSRVAVFRATPVP